MYGISLLIYIKQAPTQVKITEYLRNYLKQRHAIQSIQSDTNFKTFLPFLLRYIDLF